MRALTQRIARKLDPDDMKLVRLRGRAAEEFGDWVVISKPNHAEQVGWGRNGPIHSRIEEHVLNLEMYARRLGVLADWETLGGAK